MESSFWNPRYLAMNMSLKKGTNEGNHKNHATVHSYTLPRHLTYLAGFTPNLTLSGYMGAQGATCN